jgi:hypothetical protein
LAASVRKKKVNNFFTRKITVFTRPSHQGAVLGAKLGAPAAFTLNRIRQRRRKYQCYKTFLLVIDKEAQ